MSNRLTEKAAPISSLNHMLPACKAPVLQRVLSRPSYALVTGSLVFEAVTVHPVFGNGIQPENEAVSLLFGAAPPTQLAAVLNVPVPPPHTIVDPSAGSAVNMPA